MPDQPGSLARFFLPSLLAEMQGNLWGQPPSVGRRGFSVASALGGAERPGPCHGPRPLQPDPWTGAKVMPA